MIPYFSLEEIDIGFVKIQIWGLMFALGLIFGLWQFFREAKKIKTEKIVFDLALVIIISALVGARAYFVLNEWSYFRENLLDVFKVWEGGLGFYGGLIFAVTFGWLYLKKKGIKFWLVSDIMVISLALGEAITRLGCFLIHDHWGKITALPWGIEYLGEVRHETSLYSFLSSLILFIILLILRKKFIGQKEGFLTAFYLTWYGLISFFIYGLRATDLPGSDPFWGILRPSQYFSLLLLVLGIVLFAKRNRKK
ncbi:MAG: prolipoprotein diacylglyceryl transferase [Patescibacteria group bacterium]